MLRSSVGSTFGACVGLFFLAGLHRFLFALRATAEVAWGSKAASGLKRIDPTDSEVGSHQSIVNAQQTNPTHVSRNIPDIDDISRGVFEGFHSFVGYFLMLAVSTVLFGSPTLSFTH